ncbi:hypothetical protein D3C75_992000 [compost metagenome]
MLRTHHLFNGLGQLDDHFAVVAFGQFELFQEELVVLLTFTRHPLGTQTVTVKQSLSNDFGDNEVQRFGQTDQFPQVIPTTHFWDFGDDACSNVDVGFTNHLVHERTERLTFTGTTANVANPQQLTNCQIGIFVVCLAELRRQVKTTGRTDLGEQIDVCIEAGFLRCHTVGGTGHIGFAHYVFSHKFF